MKKRRFLKLSASALAAAAMAPVISCKSDKTVKSKPLKNWAGNLTYNTSNVFEPKSVEEVQNTIVKLKKFRTLGTRHCFNTIADSTDNLISTKNLNQVISLNSETKTITVDAGIRYGEVCQYINDKGFALHNLASLPHISIGGACATATHGSGVLNGNLATGISAIEIVNGRGEVVSLSRAGNPDAFPGALVNLGMLGVVTKVTLDLVPSFQVQQDVYLDLPLSQLYDNFETIMSAGYSVSLFYDWQSDRINQIWRKRVSKDGETPPTEMDFFGAAKATRNVHPIIELSAENCTDQMGVPGPWFDRLPHFKMGFTPSSGEELQAEYFVPFSKAVEAIQAVATLKEEIKPYILITEIRTINADTLWMSPCYKQPSVAIHFTLKQDVAGVMNLLPKIETKLEPFGVKPHWGKLFTIQPATLRARYEKLADFLKLQNQFDPDKKMVNTFIDENLLAST